MDSGNSGKNTENLKPWEPGKSGNPSGRPKGAVGFKERCREFMNIDGWPILVDMANDPKNKDRFKAVELILGYAWGKPKQGIELTGDEGDAIKIVYTTKWGNGHVDAREGD